MLQKRKEKEDDQEESQSDLDETVKAKRADASFETAEGEQDDDDEETESVKQSYLQTLENRPNSLDNIYGIRIEDNVLKIGDSPIHFTKPYVKVQNENYSKTIDLVQLFFQKQPDLKHIGSNDVENYRKIVEVTNAFRKNYSETQPLHKSKRMDYVYWDDPNELVDRLRLLLAELEAVNQSHTNEIHIEFAM